MSLLYTPDQQINDNYTETKCDECSNESAIRHEYRELCVQCYFGSGKIYRKYGEFFSKTLNEKYFIAVLYEKDHYVTIRFSFKDGILKSFSQKEEFTNPLMEFNFLPIEEREFEKEIEEAKSQLI